MKSLFIFVLFFAANASFAQDSGGCFSGFCIGTEILDQYNYHGKVIGFDASKSLVFYVKDSYSSPDSSTPGKLSKRIVSERYKEGRGLIDKYNYIGVVVSAYDNGKVIYIKDGYTSHDVGTEFAVQVEELNGFKAGVSAIDKYNYIGTVKKVFDDGRISYLKNGYSSTDISNSQSLVLEVSMLGDLQVGTVVIDKYNYIGKVVRLFADGRIEYLKEGYSSSDITKDKLGTLVKNFGDFSAETITIDQYDYIGSVKRVFSDGRIQYLKRGYSSTDIVSADKLSPKVSELGNGLKPDLIVIDKYDYVGKVLLVFKNGKAEYIKEGYSSSDIATQLYKEVEFPADQYSKEVEYASESGDVGTPLRFFENGKIQLQQQFEAQDRFVAKTLYPEVEALESLKKGDPILFVSLKSSPVERIFSNGTVIFTIQLGSKSKQVSLKLPTEELFAIIGKTWIDIIRRGGVNFMQSGYLSAIKKTDYVKLRRVIMEELETSDYSRKEKAKVTEYLPETLN